MKKIMIATPIHMKKQYCIHQFMNNVRATHYPYSRFCLVDNSTTAQFSNEFRIQYMSDSRIEVDHIHFDTDEKGNGLMHERLATSYNFLRDKFLTSDCEYFLTLECDVMIHKDSIGLLIEADKPIVQGVYYNGFFCGLEDGTGLIRLDYRGLNGISLIRRDVIEKIPFRYDKKDLRAFQDAWFFADAFSMGIESWLHRDVRCCHAPGWI